MGVVVHHPALPRAAGFGASASLAAGLPRNGLADIFGRRLALKLS
jgi:hypothetical protein